MNSTNNSVLDEKLRQLIEALINNYVNYGNIRQVDIDQHGYTPVDRRTQISFSLSKGSRYSKLIVTIRGSASVHAFVENATGFLYKAASCKVPAKHVRYKLLDHDSFADCLKRADWAGSYLYLR